MRRNGEYTRRCSWMAGPFALTVRTRVLRTEQRETGIGILAEVGVLSERSDLLAFGPVAVSDVAERTVATVNSGSNPDDRRNLPT